MMHVPRAASAAAASEKSDYVDAKGYADTNKLASSNDTVVGGTDTTQSGKFESFSKSGIAVPPPPPPPSKSSKSERHDSNPKRVPEPPPCPPPKKRPHKNIDQSSENQPDLAGTN